MNTTMASGSFRRYGIPLAVAAAVIMNAPSQDRSNAQQAFTARTQLSADVSKPTEETRTEAVPVSAAPVGSGQEGQGGGNPFPYLNLEKLESLEVVATGYTAGKESTGKTPGHPSFGITYSGVKVRRDSFSTIAADPKVFPMGTILYVPGYGYGVVADTGGAIKGAKIDLYFATRNQVFQEWGKKKVRVYILKKGEGKVTEVMLDRLNGLDKKVTVQNM